jgi:FHS family glucose/mannose:H+ symporter-like MFS transporter
LNRHLNNLSLIGYLFIGTAAILLPSVMPVITKEFSAAGLTLAAIGLIFPARSVGAIVGNILSGVGSDLLGRWRLVWLSALILAASLTLAAITKLWNIFVIGFVLNSAAQSSLSTSINALVADANRSARARALNKLHAVYGFGAAVSPLVIGYIIDQGIEWRWALGGTAIIWGIYGIATFFLSGGETAIASRGKAEKLDLRMLREGPFLALFLVAFSYNGIATSLLGWIALYMQDSAGFSPFFAVSMISVFYVALTIGRVLCAAYAERLGYAMTLFILLTGVTLTYPLIVIGIHPYIAVLGVFLSGLGFSGLFPMALAFGTRHYAEQTGTVTGTLNVAMTLGAMLPPFWTSVIAENWSLHTALTFNCIMLVPLIFLGIYLLRTEARHHKAQPAAATS